MTSTASTTHRPQFRIPSGLLEPKAGVGIYVGALAVAASSERPFGSALGPQDGSATRRDTPIVHPPVERNRQVHA